MYNKINLDWKLQLSYAPVTEFTTGCKRFNISSEVGIRIDEKEIEISMFFPDNSTLNREIFIFLNSMGAVKKNNKWRLERVAKSPKDFISIVRDILETPSSVLSSVWIENGVYQVEFVFSRLRLGSVSNIIIDRLGDIQSAKIEYLGPSGGYVKTLEAMSKRSQISVIEYDFQLSQELFPSLYDGIGKELLGIIKSPHETGKVFAVYFLNKEPEAGKNAIEIEKGKIYETTSENLAFSELNKQLSGDEIPILMKLYSLEGGKGRFFLAYQSIFNEEMIKVIHRANLMKVGFNPVIKRIQSLKEWLETSALIE